MAISAEQLTQLYLAYFGRPPDVGGMIEYTTNPVYTDIWVVAAGFSASPESVRLYGEEFGPATINAIYQNLFNRDAEPDGITYWLGEVAAGRLTPAGVAYAILLGAQNEDATTVANKMQVATEFYAALDTAEEMIGYSGDAAAATARAFLATVGASGESLEDALAGLDDAVADTVGQGGPAGDSFELKVGKDVIVGTAGNDTIEAAGASGGVLGTQTSTLESFDSIDGGAGRDTMNIYVGGEDFNTGYAVNGRQLGTVKNVEIVNIYNSEYNVFLGEDSFNLGVFGGEDGVDASKFQGAQEIWQFNYAGEDLFNVGESTTAGFADMEHEYMYVGAADGANELNIALKNIGEGDGDSGHIYVGGDDLDTVNLTGALVAPTSPGEDSYVYLQVNSGEDVSKVTVNTQVNIDLSVYGWNSDDVSEVDASGSTGGVWFNAGEDSSNWGEDIATIRTGSGDDYVNITTITAKDDVGTVADETLAALVDTGAGDDEIDVETTGTGATTVEAGEGDDSVYIDSRGDGKLTVNLGGGDDEFSSNVAINGTDVINGGDGTDGLLLSLVGAANIGAFSNFEVFDAYGLGKTLDVDILASKNTVTEIITTGSTGSATLTNLGSGVGFRAIGDQGIDWLTLTQKTAGALQVTSDIDEDEDADDGADVTSVQVQATNATSLTATFDNDFAEVEDNGSYMYLQGDKATTLLVESGGTNTTNYLEYWYGLGTASAATDGLLTTVTVTGDQALVLSLLDTGSGTAESNVVVNASGHTGGLTFNTDQLKNKGSVTIGDGADLITVGANSTATDMESIVGFEKADATALAGTSALAIADSDKLAFDSLSLAVAAADTDTTNGITINAKGVVTFTGAGPATLAAAITLVDEEVDAGEVAVFQYINDTYVFADGGSLVKLTGVTGVTQIAEVSTTDTFIIG